MYDNDCNIVSHYYLCHADSNKYIHPHNCVHRIYPPEFLPDRLSFLPFPVLLLSYVFYNMCIIKNYNIVNVI